MFSKWLILCGTIIGFVLQTQAKYMTKGNKTVEGENLYQVWLYAYNQEPNGFYGGGSLIHPRWVLTAAHCIADFCNVDVRMGSVQLDQMTYSVTSTELIVHERFNKMTLENDIGLIKLPMMATGKNIAPIEMVSKNMGQLLGKQVVAYGFGMTDSGSVSSVLLNSKMTTISYAECREKMSEMSLIKMTKRNVCAVGDDGAGICGGDSGGPLIMMVSKKPVLVGVSSWSDGTGNNCQGLTRSGFIRVSAYRCWIDNTMEENKNDS